MSNPSLPSRRLLLLIGAVLLLTACENTTNRGLQSMKLPACSAKGSVFEDKKFNDWADLYHEQVDKVVEAHMKAIKNIGKNPMQCTEEDYENVVKATEDLKETAEMLPAWKERMDDLHESDMQAVLLEFLRVYECSMDEYGLFLPVRLTSGADAVKTIGKLSEEQARIRSTITREKAVSRAALNRTLSLVSGFDRLQPLTADIECLKRSSLDLRNVLGLLSDASSCLPRVWNAKGSLRDLAE